MPVYDYKCDHCGHRFEKNQRMADDPIKVCPECGEEKVRKLLTTGGVLGSGSAGSGASMPAPSCGLGGGCAGGMCGLG